MNYKTSVVLILIALIASVLLSGCVKITPQKQPVSDSEKYSDLTNATERFAFCKSQGYETDTGVVGKDRSYYPPDAWKPLGKFNIPWQDADLHVQCYKKGNYYSVFGHDVVFNDYNEFSNVINFEDAWQKMVNWFEKYKDIPSANHFIRYIVPLRGSGS